MNISKDILDRLYEDRKFRMGMALALDVSENQVYYLIKSTRRGSSKRFLDKKSLEYLRGAGYVDAEILTEEDYGAEGMS